MSITSAARADAVGIRVPVGVALGAIVVGAAAVHAALAFRSPSPWIVPDEVIYSELAKSLGEGGLPSVRGEVTFAWGLGYPALLAPIWAMIDDVGTAYAVAKAWNAVILAATAVPAYFLARRFVVESWALVVAALSVSVPPMLYAGTLMTEVALYPACILALLAITTALERPSIRSQAAAFGAIGLACTIKTVAVVLLAAYAVAIVIYAWLGSRSPDRRDSCLRSYAPTWTILGVIVLVAGVAAAASRRPQDWLGGYATVVDHMRPADVPKWFLLHLAELDLSVAIVPFAATLIVVAHGARRDADRRERLFVALFIPVIGVWLLAVASFASIPFLEVLQYPENTQRLQGRSTFMLAPLLFIGLAMWLRDRRGRMAVVACLTAVAAVLPSAIPLEDFNSTVRFQAMSLLPWVTMRDEIAWPQGVLVFTFGLGLVFVLAFRIRASAALFVLPLVTVLLAVGLTTHLSMQWTSDWARSMTSGTTANWVDSAVAGERVSVIWAEPPGEPFAEFYPRQHVVFVGEFFNRRLDRVYEIGTPLPYNLPSTRVRLQEGQIVLENGRPAQLGELVLVPCHVRVEGVPIVRDPGTGAGVFRVRNPVSATVADPGSCDGLRAS